MKIFGGVRLTLGTTALHDTLHDVTIKKFANKQMIRASLFISTISSLRNDSILFYKFVAWSLYYTRHHFHYSRCQRPKQSLSQWKSTLVHTLYINVMEKIVEYFPIQTSLSFLQNFSSVIILNRWFMLLDNVVWKSLRHIKTHFLCESVQFSSIFQFVSNCLIRTLWKSINLHHW